MNTTAVRRRRLIAILAGFLLMIGVATGTQVTRPQAANASVTSGDVIFTRDGFSNCSSDTQIAQYNGSIETDLSDCTTNDQMPAVSPDGSRIAYQSENSSDPTLDGLYVMSSDGGNKVQVTQDCSNIAGQPSSGDSACQDYSYTDENPSWNPGGTKIVFTRQTSSGYEIDTVNTDGTGLTTLVSVGSGGYLFGGGPTSWSPDGTEILYLGSVSEQH